MRNRDDLRRKARRFSLADDDLVASEPMERIGQDAKGFPERCRRRAC
jgi:hypothetical protein